MNSQITFLTMIATLSIRHAGVIRASLGENGAYIKNVNSDAVESEVAVAGDLVARVNSGDANAEGALVARYRPRLLQVLIRMTSDPSAAEDAANEALITVILQLREAPIAQPARLGGYLYGVARNILRNAGRKANKEVYFEPELLDRVATPWLSQGDLQEQVERRVLIRRVMENVGNDRYREALIRFYLHDQTKEEIREAMQMSSKDFNQVLSRARVAFRKVLEAHDE